MGHPTLSSDLRARLIRLEQFVAHLERNVDEEIRCAEDAMRRAPCRHDEMWRKGRARRAAWRTVKWTLRRLWERPDVTASEPADQHTAIIRTNVCVIYDLTGEVVFSGHVGELKARLEGTR